MRGCFTLASVDFQMLSNNEVRTLFPKSSCRVLEAFITPGGLESLKLIIFMVIRGDFILLLLEPSGTAVHFVC